VLSVSNVDRVQNAAAAALNNAARSAARQPASVVAGPGRYLYVEAIEGQRMSVSVGGTSRSALCVRTVRDWAAADGSGRQVSGDPSPAWCDISPSQSFPAGQEIDGEVYPGARDLPADATQLKQFIVAHYEGGKSDDDATFQFAGTFLQAGATPQVRAALYRMIATFPKVESLGPMTDMLGRRGIGVGMTSYGVRDVLIFDPATSAVLEREGVVADPAAMAWPKDSARLPVGATINYTVYKSSAVVSSLTAAP
jgi:hypothetical protein